MQNGKQSNDARLVPLTSVEQFMALERAAGKDQHVVVCPTHLILKGDEIVGYASLGNVAVLNTWVCRGRVNKHESTRLLKEGERMLGQQGFEWVCLPVAKESPFRKFVKRLGYIVLGESGYNIKRVKVQTVGPKT